MKYILQYTALILTICLLIGNCLCVTASAQEKQDYVEALEINGIEEFGDARAQTGDRLAAGLKIIGISLIVSACMLLFMNYKKCI